MIFFEISIAEFNSFGNFISIIDDFFLVRHVNTDDILECEKLINKDNYGYLWNSKKRFW